MAETIYGIKYHYPATPQRSLIDNFRLEEKKQKFYRFDKELKIFDDLEFNAEGKAVYLKHHSEFIQRELNRIEKGYFFFNNGQITYITGLHYFYIQYWVLEDGSPVEYRDTDRRWFYYLDYCEKQPFIYGIIRIKKRREGATSQAACWLYWKAIMKEKARCGIVSKTGPDAKNVYQEMVWNGYNNLPVFLKPTTYDSESKNELHFFKAKSKKKKVEIGKGSLYVDDMGLDSKINYKNTALNSYDSGRLSALLLDEGGKWDSSVPVSRYWSIVKKTLIQGAKRVGFAIIPSTLNESEDGGEEFKKIWDGADNAKNQRTSNGLYRYFCPAYDGFPGYIDEYGQSIIETPTPEQKRFLKAQMREAAASGGALDIDPEIGAKEYLLKLRSTIDDDGLLNEEVRMNPFDEREAFMISEFKCYVNATIVYRQIEALKEKGVPKRRVRFYWKEHFKKVDWVDDPHGAWEIVQLPENGQENQHMETEKGLAPMNVGIFCSGIDPYKSSIITGKGSQGVIWIGKKLSIADPNNTCLPVARYVGRPRLKSMFYNEALMACFYYGCQASFERDAGDDYYEWFLDQRMIKYLSKIPDSVLKKDLGEAQTRNKKRTFGVQSGDAFALGVMLEALKLYVENHANNIYWIDFLEELLVYDHEERTKFDQTCAFMVLLTYMLGSNKPVDNKELKKSPVLRTFTINAHR